MKKPRVKAEDVARAAKVSTAAVSLVLNGKDAGRVQAETRRKILDAAKRLGYTIDRRASGLASGRSGMIGFVVPDISNPFFGLVHMSLLQELGDRYQVLVVATEVGEAPARHNIERLLAFGVEAVIAVSVDGSFVRSLRSTVPMVLVDTPVSGRGIVPINYAIEKGAAELATHLLSLGHRNFVYLDGATPSRIFGARRDTLIATMVAGGARPPVLASSAVDLAAAIERSAADCGAWLESGATAIVCATDIQAYGVLVALRDRDVAVPYRMSVASFDDLPLSAAMTPRLTAVRVPARELGEVAARELHSLLLDPTRVGDGVVLDVELHIRESTGRSPRQPRALRGGYAQPS